MTTNEGPGGGVARITFVGEGAVELLKGCYLLTDPRLETFWQEFSDLFQDLEEKWHVGNWPVVLKIHSVVKVGFSASAVLL